MDAIPIDSQGRAWWMNGGLLVGDDARTRRIVCEPHPDITPPAAFVFQLTGITYTECATHWDHRRVVAHEVIACKRRDSECSCQGLFYGVGGPAQGPDVSFRWAEGVDPTDSLAAHTMQTVYARNTGAAATSTYATLGGPTLARAHFAEAGVLNLYLSCGIGTCSHGGAAFSFSYDVSVPAGGVAYVWEGTAAGVVPSISIGTDDPTVCALIADNPPSYTHRVTSSGSYTYRRAYPSSGLCEMLISIAYVQP